MYGRFGGPTVPTMWQFYGLMDEIRVSSTARYTEDFQPALRHTPDSETLLLYHLDEGDGTVAHDASGNGRDGQIINATGYQQDFSTSDESLRRTHDELTRSN